MSQAPLYEPVVLSPQPPNDPRIASLIWWAARLSELGFTPSYGPGDHGNLSCRTSTGLLISARETEKARLQPDQFVDVVAKDVSQAGSGPVRIACRGPRLPSTDAWMHLRIYGLRPDIHAILHGHDRAALANAAALRLPITTCSAAAPSRSLVDEVCELAKSYDYLLMRDHGFLALGASIDEAGELARRVNASARSAGER